MNSANRRVAVNFARWALAQLSDMEGLDRFGVSLDERSESVTLHADVRGRRLFNIYTFETIHMGERGFQARAFGFFAELGSIVASPVTPAGPLVNLPIDFFKDEQNEQQQQDSLSDPTTH